MDPTGKHVTEIEGSTHFHTGSRNGVVLGFRRGTVLELRGSVELETHIQTQADIEVVVFERVAENNRNIENEYVDATRIRVDVHILFINVVTVVEGEFRNKAQVLQHEVHLEHQATTRLEAHLPAIGIFAKERVGTDLRTDTEHHGTGKALVTHTVDFRLLCGLRLVAGIRTGIFLVVRKLTIGRTIVSRSIVPRGTLGGRRSSPPLVIGSIVLSHDGYGKRKRRGKNHTQSLKIHNSIIINEYVKPA